MSVRNWTISRLYLQNRQGLALRIVRLFILCVHVQRAAGNWESDNELWAMIGKSEAEIVASKPANASVVAWVTALAITFLEVRTSKSTVGQAYNNDMSPCYQTTQGDTSDRWYLSVKKAKKWLTRNISQPLDEFMSLAHLVFA